MEEFEREVVEKLSILVTEISHAREDISELKLEQKNQVQINEGLELRIQGLKMKVGLVLAIGGSVVGAIVSELIHFLRK